MDVEELPKRSGNVGANFTVSNHASERGLSLPTREECGDGLAGHRRAPVRGEDG